MIIHNRVKDKMACQDQAEDSGVMGRGCLPSGTASEKQLYIIFLKKIQTSCTIRAIYTQQNENVPSVVFLFHLHSCPDSSSLIAAHVALSSTSKKLSKSQDWNVNGYKNLPSYFQEHKGNVGAERGQKLHLDRFWAWQFYLWGIFCFKTFITMLCNYIWNHSLC